MAWLDPFDGAHGKGARPEMESEGSRRQSADPANRHRIRGGYAGREGRYLQGSILVRKTWILIRRITAKVDANYQARSGKLLRAAAIEMMKAWRIGPAMAFM